MKTSPTFRSPLRIVSIVAMIPAFLTIAPAAPAEELPINDVNRYAVSRGGSFYQVGGSGWYFDRFVHFGLGQGEWSARPTNYHTKLFLMSPSTDRKATIGFRCVKDVGE